MRVQVNQEKCSGCEACLAACPVNAISLDSGKAAIDQALCTRCAVCLSICPSDAICAEAEPVQIIPAVERTMARAPLNSTNGVPRTLAPWAGAALTFLGRELVPRLADVLVTALERRLAQSISSPVRADGHPVSAHKRWPNRRRQRRRGDFS